MTFKPISAAIRLMKALRPARYWAISFLLNEPAGGTSGIHSASSHPACAEWLISQVYLPTANLDFHPMLVPFCLACYARAARTDFCRHCRLRARDRNLSL